MFEAGKRSIRRPGSGRYWSVDVSRRQVLLGFGALALTGRVVQAPWAFADSTLPSTQAWRPRQGEVQPAVKAQATRLIESVGAWSGLAGSVAAARRRASAAGFNAALVDGLSDLLGPEQSAVVQVRDAQYGGILSDSASVLVVVDQWTGNPGGAIRPGGSTFDVRLVRASPIWRVIDVFPAAPDSPRSHLTRKAEAVLANDRIRLPFAARADVAAGGIHDTVLSALNALAVDHVADVSVLRSGHPLHVFGTSRLSDHPRGRAVDIWALDDQPLVLPRNRPLAVNAMRFAVAHGAYNVGGPVQLNGSQYFSDRTHQDHVHMGFRT
jgi:hypothetical protein